VRGNRELVEEIEAQRMDDAVDARETVYCQRSPFDSP
jgi:hypothetical protein